MDENPAWPGEMQEGRGRSAAKRQAQAVEALARQLVELPEAQLPRLLLPDDVRGELRLARSQRGGSAGKRQLKHLGGLLRRDDELRAIIETQLAGAQAERHREALAFHRLEELRERLVDPALQSEALAEVAASFPQLDRDRLSGLARAVLASRDKRAYREIFRLLRQAAAAMGGEADLS